MTLLGRLIAALAAGLMMALALGCSTSSSSPANSGGSGTVVVTSGGAAAGTPPVNGPAVTGGGGCSAGQTSCGQSCVDTSSDAAHCGSCDAACGAGALCSAGQCQCQAGLTACGDLCIDVSADGANCGGCGAACAAEQVCSEGLCKTGCDAGLLQCGVSCVDTKTSVEHCGQCDTPCSGSSTCSAGACTCPPGQSYCDGQCVDVTTDALNCGFCGKVCTAGACTAGECPGGKNCALMTKLATPEITNFDDYDGNKPIGEWGFSLNAAAGFRGAVYAGPYQFSDDTGAQMLSTTTGYNSTYGLKISNTEATKWGGSLGFWMGCVDASEYDGLSFWAKGSAPGDEATLALSMEETSPPSEKDPNAGGTCTDECAGPSASFPVSDTWTRIFLPWSAFEPGSAAGKPVPANGQKITGLVLSANLSWGQVGADPNNFAAQASGYELEIDSLQFFSNADSCPAGTEICGAVCTDPQTDVNNCGACGNVCPSGAACVAGGCVCPGGQTACLESCVDTSTHPAHCGACGTVCPINGACEAGQCTGGGGKSSNLCGSPMTLLGNPLGCKFGWAVNDEGSVPGYVDFFSKWVGYENNINSRCDGCSFLSKLAGKDVVPMYIAYVIAYRAKRKGYDDCNLDFDGQNLCTHGAEFIRNNRKEIVDIYASYAARSYKVYSSKPVIWLIEPDLIQYVDSGEQTKPLTMAELGALATDIVCAIKSNMPNAVIALTHSSWTKEPLYSEYWKNMPLELADFVHATGRADSYPYINKSDANNRSDGTWKYLGDLTGKPIIADTSFGVTEMADSWSTSPAPTLNMLIGDGLAGVLVGRVPGNYEGNIGSLSPSLGSTCE